MCLLICIANPVKAGEISSVNTSYKDSVVAVNGTTQSSVVAAVVMLYDQSGENLIAMQSIQVNQGSYACTFINITLANGTYQVKVADYEGGEYVTGTFTVSGAQTTTTTSPETGETVLYIIFAAMIVSGMSAVYLKDSHKKVSHISGNSHFQEKI